MMVGIHSEPIEDPLHDEDSRKILLLTSKQLGDHIVYGKLRITVPRGASLRWPARQHNPYTKDGCSTLPNAKLVLVLPFADVAEHRIILSHR